MAYKEKIYGSAVSPTQGHFPSIVLTFLIISLWGIPGRVPAQEPPLEPTGLFDRSEIIMVWDEGTTGGARIHEQNLKLKFNFQGFETGERFTGAEAVVTDSMSYDDRQFDIISGDFNGDNMADYVYSLTGDGDSLHLVLARRLNTLHYTERNIYKFDGRILPGKNLIHGDLNGDGRTEFVAGYRTFGEEMARVAVFGFDDDFRIELIDRIDPQAERDNFAIDLCDLDGDGDDELVLGFISTASATEYVLQVYDFDTDLGYTEKARLEPELDFNANSYGYAALTGADFDLDGREEIVTAFNKNELDAPNNPDTYLYMAEVTDDPGTGQADPLEMISLYRDGSEAGRYNYGGIWQILLKPGDLNGDGQPEMLLGCHRGVEIFTVDTSLQIAHLGKGSDVIALSGDLPSVNYFDVADMTGDDLDDIVAVNHFFSNEPVGTQSFSIRLVRYDSLFNSTIMESVYQYNEIDNGGGGGRNETHFAVSLSDFDGDLFRIGDYTSLGCFTDVIRPVTVLNTPPVHIDYINGTVHDVNECFGQNDCFSSVQKSTEQYSQEEFSIQTSSTGDWGYDPEFTVGANAQYGPYGGVSMSGIEVASYFGDDLEEVAYDVSTSQIGKSTSTSFFQTASMDTRFSRDDAILTIVSDYERWEYPVFNQYDEILGEIIILIPQTTNQENWLRGRQVLEVAGMAQLHEPGNLLSYRKFYDDPEELMEVNPDIREIIAIAKPHELDLNSTYTESITWGTEFENKDVSVENMVETLPSYGLNILGIQLGVEDESVAEQETVTSHSYTVGKNLGIEVYGSYLAANSYEYSVRPYYYWSKNGALVVDYMIDLSEGSFWQENYSLQDPGFVLPNRLDSLKVKNSIDRITDLDEYTKTPSIFFDPAIPVNGDTATVTAIVHNLSLSPTNAPVELSFYLGDPDNGGTLISDVDGNTLFTTEEIIEDQNYAMLSFRWVADFERFDRMYGVIDPGGKLTENKLDNNKAWAPVQRFADCGETTSADRIPVRDITFRERFAVYPNPAGSTVYLDYSGPPFEQATLSVVDLSGRLWQKETLHYGEGISRYTFETAHLQTGMYILVISTEHYSQRIRILIE